ncbi:MAG TPA: hypothetical protein VGK81_06445 [Anaerolineae bacterium]|jgi:hypothetical protein
MNVIEKMASDPLQWSLAGLKIVEGSILQIQRGADWITVHVNYHFLLRELRFYLDETATESIPIIEGTPARWLETLKS